MGDLEFKAIKEFQGKLRYKYGAPRTGDGLVALLTAVTGKDLYLASAKCVFSVPAYVGSLSPYVVLKANNIVLERVNFYNTSNTRQTFEYEFKNVGHKVLAGQQIRMEYGSSYQSISVNGFIEGWLENTGETPQIPAI